MWYIVVPTLAGVKFSLMELQPPQGLGLANPWEQSAYPSCDHSPTFLSSEWINISFPEVLLPSLRNRSFPFCWVFFESSSPDRPVVLKLSRGAGCLLTPGSTWTCLMQDFPFDTRGSLVSGQGWEWAGEVFSLVGSKLQWDVRHHRELSTWRERVVYSTSRL